MIIYKMTHKPTGKIYIGSLKDDNRWELMPKDNIEMDLSVPIPNRTLTTKGINLCQQ